LPSPIHGASSQKIYPTALLKSGTTALARSAAAFSQSALPTAPKSSASTGLVTGAKESEFMSEKIRYTDEPLGDLEVVPDFLPRPEDLIFRDEGVKVTIALSKRSVEFFKNEAQKHNTQYQRMIRRLLDAYAEHHSRRSLTARSARTRAKSARAG
jgi:predicted DNA binding CopG/RHH family protein